MAYTNIDDPTLYFNTVLYTGNGSTQSITGVNFQPDFTWIKRRGNAEGNSLFDIVRGVEKRLVSNTTASETTSSTFLTSFDTDGFSLGGNDAVNGSDTYASWNWLAGGTGVSNTDGSITSTVSANTTSGFSIVSYTGTGSVGTVGHGLGTTPAMIIVKDRTTAGEYWHVYHKSLGGTKAVYLNTTDASVTTGGSWNSTEPTSTVFSIGTLLDTPSANFIGYCFAEKKGFSKFGSYTGNNSTNGPFIYCGFKPAFVLIKSTNAAQWWTLLDNTRDAYNQASLGLSPNSSNSESTFNTDRGPHYMDFVSNGFKIRTDNSAICGTNSFIYMAFASEPLVGTNNVPATAR